MVFFAVHSFTTLFIFKFIESKWMPYHAIIKYFKKSYDLIVKPHFEN